MMYYVFGELAQFGESAILIKWMSWVQIPDSPGTCVVVIRRLRIALEGVIL